MKKTRLSALFLLLSLAAMAKAQSVIAVQIEQHPPLGVAADNVDVVLPEGGVTLGSGVSVSGGDGNYSYRWTDANGDVLGTEPTLDINSAGDYYLAVTDGSDCSVSVKFSATASTGIASVERGGTSIASDGRNIIIESAKPIRSVRIVAADGRLVSEHNAKADSRHAEISAERLRGGVYLVGCVFTDNSETVKKITIK